jgi:uncharacterized membrane protein YgaE (UPF0421/DUF939 family)
MNPPAAAAPATVHDRLTFQQATRTAIAAGLAAWLTHALHMPGGYWAAISAIIVMQSEVGATLTASKDRLVGTALGATVGWITALYERPSLWIFALAVLVVMVLCTALKFQNAGRLGGVTVAIIILIPHTGPVWKIAVERFLEVSFGIAISLAVAQLWEAARRWLARHPHSA